MTRFFGSLAVAVFALGIAGLSDQDGERTRVVAPVAQDAKPPAGSPTWAPGGKRERWTPENCVFAFIDHQTGLMNLVHNAPPTEFKNIVIGLAKLAKLHNVPSVLTTSAETGPNGPMLPEIIQLLPNAPKISAARADQRVGEPRLRRRDQEDRPQEDRDVRDHDGRLRGVRDALGARRGLRGLRRRRRLGLHERRGPARVDRCACRRPGRSSARGSGSRASSSTTGAIPAGAGSAQLFIEHMPSYARGGREPQGGVAEQSRTTARSDSDDVRPARAPAARGRQPCARSLEENSSRGSRVPALVLGGWSRPAGRPRRRVPT